MSLRKKLTTLILLGGAVSLFAAKAKAQESTVLPDYDKIRASGSIKLELIQADRHSYYSKGTAEDLKEVEIGVENRMLTVKSKNKSNTATIKLYFKDLKSIECQGIVSVSADDSLRLSQLQIKTDGASSVKLNLNVNQLKADANGVSEIKLSGVCESFTAQANGAASIKADNLTAGEAQANANGTSSIKLNVTNRLNATADGVASIKFKGNPEYKNISINGMASVKNLADGEEYNTDEADGTQIIDGDTTRVKIGKRKFIIIDEDDKKKQSQKDEAEQDPLKKRRMKRVWSGFELGVNGMVTPDMGFGMKSGYKNLNTNFGRSWFIGLNFPEIDGHIIRNKLAITTGLGLKWTWMEFETDDIMRPDTNKLVFIASGNKLQENELNTFNLTLPVLLKFAPGNKKRASKGFHLATGVIVNYVATTRLKTVTNDNGFEKTTHYESDFNINPFRVDATVRFGYDKLRFFANYSLTPYFDSSKAPDIRTFSAGMTLIGF